MTYYIDSRRFSAMQLADHIELEHERELAGFLPMGDLLLMHQEMHQFDHWGHTHRRRNADEPDGAWGAARRARMMRVSDLGIDG